MAKVYIYVVARDFGFAPNPFHGICTLATCKADLRSTAQVGDWVIGMGGARLKATGRCVFAMKVTETATYDEYWENPAYRAKRPSRNGSRKTAVGDNIYHRASETEPWLQEDSHHSQPDGSQDAYNTRSDTKTNKVLISRHFLYFGCAAVEVPAELLDAAGYENGRGHRVFQRSECDLLVSWLSNEFRDDFNMIVGDPFDFNRSSARYSYRTDKVTP